MIGDLISSMGMAVVPFTYIVVGKFLQKGKQEEGKYYI